MLSVACFHLLRTSKLSEMALQIEANILPNSIQDQYNGVKSTSDNTEAAILVGLRRTLI